MNYYPPPTINLNRSIGFNLELFRMNVTQVITDGCECYPWRKAFVWFPVVTVSGKRIWCKKVYKRRVWVVWGNGVHMQPVTQYASAFDLLTYQDLTTTSIDK